MRRSFFGIFLALTAFGCATVKQARPVPEKVEPSVAVEPGPPVQGQGTVTVDVVDGHARANIVVAESSTHAHSTYYGSGAVGFGYAPFGRADPFYRGPTYYDGMYPGGFLYWPDAGYTEMHGVQTRFLCDTPCRVNLPYGSYRLQLSLLDRKRTVDNDGTFIVGEKPSIFRRALTLRDEKPGLQFAGVVFTALGWSGAIALAPGIADGVYNIKRGAAIGGTAALVSVGVAGIVMLVKGRTVITPGSQVQWISETPPEPAVAPPRSESPPVVAPAPKPAKP